MMYESYQRRIRRRYRFFRLLKKYKTFLIIIASLTTLFTTTALTTKGSIYNITYNENLNYGQDFKISSKSIFSKVSYQYRLKGSSTWSNIKPDFVGDYEIKITTKGAFKSTKEKIIPFSITEKESELKLKDNKFIFGDEPLYELDLKAGDKVENISFIFEDISQTKTNIELENIVIYNNNNKNVTDQYKILFPKQEITFIPREITVKLDDYEATYNALDHMSDSYKITNGSLRVNDSLTVSSKIKLKDAGKIDNIVSDYQITYNDIDLKANYKVTFINGIIEVLPKTIKLKPVDKITTYNGEVLMADEIEFLEETELVEDELLTYEFTGLIINVGKASSSIENIVITKDKFDVTKNYNIIIEEGLLEVKQATIDIIVSGTKVYDGTNTLTANYRLTEGVLFVEDKLKVTASLNDSLVGIKEVNDITPLITNGNNEDITDNYIIKPFYETFEITKKKIVVTVDEIKKDYDGNNLFAVEDVSLSEPLINDQILELTVYVDNSDIGKKVSLDQDFKILDNNNNDYTNNYKLTFDYSGFSILPQIITIKPTDEIKVYDGINLTSTTAKLLSGFIPEGYEIIITTNAKKLNVGSSINEITSTTIYSKDDIDVTDNFVVNTESGILEITKRPVIIKPVDEIKIYDGTPLTSDVAELVDGSLELVNGHYLVITTDGMITNVGSIDNVITSYDILDNYDESILFNYEVTIEIGVLEITPRPITIKPADDIKIYDGTPLTSDVAELVDESLKLVNGHHLVITTNGTIINVGDILNEITSFDVLDENDKSILFNYEVTTKKGILEITKRPVIIKPKDKTKVYDGTPLTSNIAELVAGSLELVLDHYLVITSESITNAFTAGNEITSYDILDCNDESILFNYEVTTEKGTLEIIPRPITIKPVDKVKVYDGTPLTSNVAELVDGSLELVLDHYLVITSESITDAITAGNEITYYDILDGNDESVLLNYEVTTEKAVLEITKRPVTIKPVDEVKVYDGTPLTSNVAELVDGSLGLVLEHYFVIISESITDAITAGNEITYYDILDGNDESVLFNYEVTTEKGILEITKRPVTIKPVDEVKIYDGTPLTSNVAELVDSSLELVEGHYLIITTEGIITDVGRIDNFITSYDILDNNDESILFNYYVSTAKGILEITPRPITIKPVDETKIYDGTPLTSNVAELVNGSLKLVDGHYLVITTEGIITDVGSIDNFITSYDILDDNDESILFNYEITTEKGVLEITPRPITIKPADETKIYDGTHLTSNIAEVTVESLKLVVGHTLVITTDGIITDVGSIDNFIISYDVLDDNDESILFNYEVTTEKGILEITPRPIIIKPVDETKIYDGTPLTSNVAELVAGSLGLVLDHYLVITSESITDAITAGNEITYYDILDGNDKSILFNYEVTAEKGTLEIIPRPITIKPVDETKIYDGTPLTSNVAELVDGSLDLVLDHYLVIKSESITDAITVDNEITYYDILDDNDESILFNYEVTTEKGILKITPRPITIKPLDKTKIYDGTLLTSNVAELVDESLELVEGHYIIITTKNSLIDVDLINNEIDEYQILDNNDNLVTNNYKVTKELGVLEVTKRPITIKPKDKTKVYDGTLLTSNVAEIVDGSLGLVLNHYLVITSENITDAVIVDNEITSYDILDESNESILFNYEVATEKGILEITKRPITIKPVDETKIYDGTPLTSSVAELVDGSLELVENHYILITTDGTITDVGSIDNFITSYNIFDENNESIKYNYDITTESGILKITPRPVTIKPVDETKIYDGTSLTSNISELVDGSLKLVDGHYLVITAEGIVTDVGSVDNLITSYDILDDNDESILFNYEVTTEKGTLKITKRPITIKPVDETKIYDGTPLTSNVAELVDGSLKLVDGHYLVITTTGSITDVSLTANFVTSADVFNENDELVNHNYLIGTLEGSLKIDPRPITIKPADDAKIYDGTALTSNFAQVTDESLKLVVGHTLVITTDGTITHVGSIDNFITFYDILDDNDESILFNYEVTTEKGILKITPRPIIIKPVDETKIYDGTALTSNIVELVDESLKLVENHYILITTDGTITDVGSIDNFITFYDILDDNDESILFNYEVTTKKGILKITPRSIIIKPVDEVKIYDGTPLTSNIAELVDGSLGLVLDHYLVITTDGTITNVGDTVNKIISADILDENDKSIKYNYDITTESGIFKITPRPIIIKPVDETKIYDGTLLTSNFAEVTDESLKLVVGHTLVITTNGTITNVGDTINEIISADILDENDKSIKYNYDLTTESGILKITPRPITIKPVDETKIYDGTALISNVAEVTVESLKLVVGHSLVITTDGSITDAGSVDNFIISYDILDDNNETILFNYEVTTIKGNLEIIPRPITIKPVDEVKIYDGIPLTSNIAELTNESLNLVIGHYLVITTTGSITDVGSTDNFITSYDVLDDNNESVFHNYDITTIKGTLQITKRPITIKPVDEIKIYDGTPLTSSVAELVDGSLKLVDDHYIVIITDGTITDVGNVFNKITSFNIFDNNDVSVLGNYEVTTTIGTLQITKRPITIKSVDEVKIYDGTALTSNVAEVATGSLSLVLGHFLVITTDGTITDVGSTDNFITSYDVLDANNISIIGNYEVTTIKGFLEIVPRPITIKPVNDTKIYDGTTLTSNLAEIAAGSLGLVLGHYLVITTDGTIINVGSVDNFITSYDILDDSDKSILFNYDVTTIKGTLEIVSRPITIKPVDEVKIYDGTALTSNIAELVAGSLELVVGHQLLIITDGTITNVGDTINEIISADILDENDKSIKYNYDITTESGILKITPRLITIKPVDKTKTYDGVAFTSNEVELVSGTLVLDHQVKIVASGSITELGEVDNFIVSYTITTLSNESVKENYEVTLQQGYLKVIKAPIEIKPINKSKQYDGTALFADEAEASFLAPGHFLITDVIGSQTIIGESDSEIISYQIVNITGDDCLKYYDVEVLKGTLTVTKIKLEIKITDKQKLYDGTPLISDEFIIVENDLLDNHNLTIITDGIQLDPGLSENNLTSYTITDQNGNDVSSYYDLTANKGLLVVGKLEVTIKPTDEIKEYDGTPLSSQSLEIVDGGLLYGITISASVVGEQTTIGTSSSEIVSYQILDINLNDITNYYEVTTLTGLLEVTLRQLIITPTYESKEYNGIPLTSNKATIVDGSLLVGHNLTINTTGSITEIGVANNYITNYSITDNLGNDVSQFYDVTKVLGELEITLREFIIKPIDRKKMYDGTPLVSNDIEEIKGSLLASHRAYITTDGSITEIGIIYNNITSLIIKDNNDVDVTHYYNIYLEKGILQVYNKIELYTESDSKDYDGSPLYNYNYYLKEELLEDHQIQVVMSASITEVGMIVNDAYYIITDKLGNDVTELYYVEENFGFLIVFGSDVNGDNDPFDYELSDVFDKATDFTKINLFKIKTDYDGHLYLKGKSMGDFDGFNKWEVAPIFNLVDNQINPLQIPALLHLLNDYQTNNFKLQALYPGLAYYLPYYAENGFNNSLNDTYIVKNYGSGYELDYVANFDYSLSAEGTIYEELEQAYREFVYQNYLDLPESTKTGLLEIALNNGLFSESPTLINDIKNYILSAAEYNLEFKKFPEETDFILAFLNDIKEGVCQHFAAAAVGMYRALGIPARYTTGFVADAVANQWVNVNPTQAHAWVEVYIDGFGWVIIEVTPGSPFGTGPYSPGGDDNLLDGQGDEQGDMDYEEGKRVLTFISKGDSKIYDGQPLVNHDVYYNGNLQVGHHVFYIYKGTITDVGIKENLFDVYILDDFGEDVTDEYNINKIYGELVVVPDNGKELLELFAYSKTMTYDGTDHEINNNDFFISKNPLPEGAYIVLEIIGTQHNVGYSKTTIKKQSIKVYDQNDTEITNNYNIVAHFGIIEVILREIILTSGSASKVYDGKPLSYDKYSILGSIVDTHTMEVVMESEITEIGFTENLISDVVIYDEFGNDVTKNYLIKINLPGTLTILEPNIN